MSQQEPQATLPAPYSVPMSYRNWLAHEANEPIRGRVEVRVIGDSHITGEIIEGLGPYQVLNGLSLPPGRPGSCVLVIRSTYCGEYQTDLSTTQSSAYHGSSLEDEVAALLSLELGIRLKAGAEMRHWFRDWDGPGQPTELGADPPLSQGYMGRAVLPFPKRVNGVPLAGVHRLQGLVRIEPRGATALVRSARSFQDAVWIADSQPELAWLLLISAVETAASFAVTDEGDPVQYLTDGYGPFMEKLSAIASAEAVNLVAEHLAPISRAAYRFRTFLLDRLPPPPTPRPQFRQVQWEAGHLQRCLRTIYTHRSNMLHKAQAFPMPMCIAPSVTDTAPWECPGTSGGQGGAWLDEDLPMHLHVFVYWVRAALLAWWDELLTTS